MRPWGGSVSKSLESKPTCLRTYRNCDLRGHAWDSQGLRKTLKDINPVFLPFRSRRRKRFVYLSIQTDRDRTSPPLRKRKGTMDASNVTPQTCKNKRSLRRWSSQRSRETRFSLSNSRQKTVTLLFVKKEPVRTTRRHLRFLNLKSLTFVLRSYNTCEFLRCVNVWSRCKRNEF